MTIGDRIKHYRNLRGLTQTELAQKAGVQFAAISKYELGTVTNIPWERIERLAAALEIPPGWLIGFEEIVDPDRSDEYNRLVLLCRNLDDDQIRLLLSMAEQMSK
jgi:transcriptional regulator with XRE-family HTH domain